MAGASETVVMKGNWEFCTVLSVALILCPSWLALDQKWPPSILLIEKAQSWHPGMLFLWSVACKKQGHRLGGVAVFWFTTLTVQQGPLSCCLCRT